MMAELAIWMSGGTTVFFPTESAETVKYVLEHSGASLLFVGKLDSFDQQVGGIPAGLPAVSRRRCRPKQRRNPGQHHGENRAHRWQAGLVRGRTSPYTSGSTGKPKGVIHSFERHDPEPAKASSYEEKRSRREPTACCRTCRWRTSRAVRGVHLGLSWAGSHLLCRTL